MTNQRAVALFRNGRNQAVRIPREFELPGSQALLRRDGDSLVITPIKPLSLLDVLATMTPLDEDFLAMDDPLPSPVHAL